jgi:SAM-dependent methyltransferase
MDRDDWDRRYAEKELVWSVEPNSFLVEEASGLTPGKAADLATGEGRNAIWLAERGWRVTAVDYSRVGLDKARQIAKARGVAVDWIEADLLEYEPAPGDFDLVIIFYLQLPWEWMHRVLHSASGAVAPGGTLLLVGHDRTNLEGGHGGPKDPGVLYTPDEVAGELSSLEIVEAARRRRDVETDDGTATAIDCLVRAVAKG